MRVGECDAIFGEEVVPAEEARYSSQLEYISQHMIMKGVVEIDHFFHRFPSNCSRICG